MKATKKYLLLVAACAALSVSAVAFTACGDTHTHTLVKTDGVDATCTTDGAEAYWTCSDCEKMFSDEAAKHEIKAVVVIPGGHKLDKTDEVPATCEGTGTKAYWTCSACDKMFSDENANDETEITETVAIPAKGHKLVKTDEVPATCEEAGTEEYWSCSACKKKFGDADGKNEIQAPAAIPALTHNWNDEYVKTATMHYYTCKNDSNHHKGEANHDDDGESGEDYTTCSVCGYKHEHSWSDYISFNDNGHHKECTTGANTHTTAIGAHDTDGANGTCSKCGYKGIPTVTLTVSNGTGTVSIETLDGNGAKLVIEGAEDGKFYQLSANQENVGFSSWLDNPYMFEYSYFTSSISVGLIGDSSLTNVVITIEELPEVEPVEIELDEEVTVSGAAYERPLKYYLTLEEGYYQIILNGETYTEYDMGNLAFGYYEEDWWGDEYFVDLTPDSQNCFEVSEGGDVYYIEAYENVTFKVIKVEDYEGGDEEPDGTMAHPFTATTGETISANIDMGLGITEVWFLFEATEGGTYTLEITDEDANFCVYYDPNRNQIAYSYGTNCTVTLAAGDVVYILAAHNNNQAFTFTITAGGNQTE